MDGPCEKFVKIFAFTRARLQIPQQGLSYADKSKGTAYIVRAWTFSASAELCKAARIFNLKRNKWTFLRCQEVLLSPKDKFSSVV